MDAACRLRVIAWLFVVLGIDGAIEQIVSLFRPIEFDSVCSLLPGLNVQILALPVGIGLHRRNALAHRIAVGINWLFPILFSIAAVILVFALITGGEMTWHGPESTDGAEMAREIRNALVGIPLFVWQFRALRSSDVRELFAAPVTSDSGSASA